MHRIVRAATIVGAAWLAAAPAEAIVINSVRGHSDLFRPVDGVFYPFPIEVTATIDAAEAAAGASFPFYFRDMFAFRGDPLIDGVTLHVPAGQFSAGETLRATFNLLVGCSNTQFVDGFTFGPFPARRARPSVR